MKKLVIIVVSILLCIGLFLIARSIYNNKNQYKPLEGDEELYALTEQEVDRINANSNFLGCVLLGESHEDATAQLTEIRDSTKDYYICFPYRGGNYITAINLFSEDANFYGISVGDSLEKMALVMDEQDFLQQGSTPECTLRFAKYYISVSFGYNEENVITEISLSVTDPVYVGIDY